MTRRLKPSTTYPMKLLPLLTLLLLTACVDKGATIAACQLKYQHQNIAPFDIADDVLLCMRSRGLKFAPESDRVCWLHDGKVAVFPLVDVEGCYTVVR